MNRLHIRSRPPPLLSPNPIQRRTPGSCPDSPQNTSAEWSELREIPKIMDRHVPSASRPNDVYDKIQTNSSLIYVHSSSPIIWTPEAIGRARREGREIPAFLEIDSEATFRREFTGGMFLNCFAQYLANYPQVIRIGKRHYVWHNVDVSMSGTLLVYAYSERYIDQNCQKVLYRSPIAEIEYSKVRKEWIDKFGVSVALVEYNKPLDGVLANITSSNGMRKIETEGQQAIVNWNCNRDFYALHSIEAVFQDGTWSCVEVSELSLLQLPEISPKLQHFKNWLEELRRRNCVGVVYLEDITMENIEKVYSTCDAFLISEEQIVPGSKHKQSVNPDRLPRSSPEIREDKIAESQKPYFDQMYYDIRFNHLNTPGRIVKLQESYQVLLTLHKSEDPHRIQTLMSCYEYQPVQLLEEREKVKDDGLCQIRHDEIYSGELSRLEEQGGDDFVMVCGKD